MRGLGRLLRSRSDYACFQVSNEWPLVLTVAGVILGVVTMLPSAVGIVLGAIAFVAGLGEFLRELHEFRRRWADYEFTATAAPFPPSRIPPPGAYPAPVYIHVPGRGTALVSDPIDQALATVDLQAQLDDEPYQLPKYLKASAPHVLRVANHGRTVFNGKIIGMRSDPLPPGATPAPPITLHVAHFFDAQCSNEMCTLRIAHRETDEEFDPRIQLLTNANGHLRTLAESTLADCVGISTIAFTTDRHLALTRHTSPNIPSAPPPSPPTCPTSARNSRAAPRSSPRPASRPGSRKTAPPPSCSPFAPPLRPPRPPSPDRGCQVPHPVEIQFRPLARNGEAAHEGEIWYGLTVCSSSTPATLGRSPSRAAAIEAPIDSPASTGSAGSPSSACP